MSEDIKQESVFQDSIEFETIRSVVVGQNYQRSFNFEHQIDFEKRQAEFSFSSEHPVDRGRYFEVLGHNEDEIDTSALLRAPLLQEHDRKLILGTIENFTLKDGKMRSLARFAPTSLGEDALKMVRDGIFHQVSVGYRVLDMKKVDQKDGKPVMRLRWQPYENSLVAIAADPTVGIGRSANLESSVNSEGTIKMEKTRMEDIKKDTVETTVVRELKDPEIERRDQILELGVRNGYAEDAQRFIYDKKPAAEFYKFVSDKISQKQVEATRTVTPEITFSNKERQRYNLAEAIRSLASDNPQKAAPFEWGISQEVNKTYGTSTRELTIPWAFTNTRVDAGTVTYTTEGANWVPTQLDTTQTISPLGNRLVLTKLGVTEITGPKAVYTIPKILTGPEAKIPASENADYDQTNATGDLLTLTPHRLRTYFTISDDLSFMSPMAIQQLIINEGYKDMARKIQDGALNGGGSTAVTGLLNLAINDGNLSSTGVITFADIVNLETLCATDNADDFAQLAYLTSSKVRGYCKGHLKTSPSTEFMWVDNPLAPGEGQLNGRRALTTNTLSDTSYSKLIYGAWENMIIVYFGPGITMKMDTMSKIQTGEVGIAMSVLYDVGVKYLNAFASCENISGI